jgi:hypothetical protein
MAAMNITSSQARSAAFGSGGGMNACGGWREVSCGKDHPMTGVTGKVGQYHGKRFWIIA